MPETKTAGSQVEPELSDRWPIRFGVPLTLRVPAIGRSPQTGVAGLTYYLECCPAIGATVK
jgi:hypothetical protein